MRWIRQAELILASRRHPQQPKRSGGPLASDHTVESPRLAIMDHSIDEQDCRVGTKLVGR
jgi:hypothetical protein